MHLIGLEAMSTLKIVQTNILGIVAHAICWLRVDPTYGRRLSDKWLPPSTLVEALKMANIIDSSFHIDERIVGRAMVSKFGGSSMDNFNVSNASGVYRVKLGAAYSEVERLMKDFKVHRCALDFYRGFVSAELRRSTQHEII